MLHLAVDARDALRDPRGIGRYVREILRRFAAADDVTLTLLVDATIPLLMRERFARLLGRKHFSLARRVPRSCDVVWHPWNGTFFQGGQPAVATIHDVVPFAYPDRCKRDSQQQPFLRSAATSATIITDSGFSAREIERHLRVPAERIAVIPLGVSPDFSPGPSGGLPQLQGRPYVLTVGTDEPHKNVSTLVAAFALAFQQAEVMLVGLGAHLPQAPGFLDLAGVNDADLAALYRGALFLAAPGLCEGFGLPALEAMACGTPVLAARSGPFPEIYGNAAAYVDPPNDPAAWIPALVSLANDAPRRALLRTRGLERAAGYTWDRTARETLATLRACACAKA